MTKQSTMNHLPNRSIRVAPLSPDAFAPFGEVIQNPATHLGMPNVQKVEANQGSATKWLNITSMKDHYDLAVSGVKANVAFNMFVCKPRTLSRNEAGQDIFEVRILERHPYTPQTFIPLSLDRGDRDTYYLVIVAPTLPEHEQDTRFSLHDRTLNVPRSSSMVGNNPSDQTEAEVKPKGRGPPELGSIQAFIARGDQCVTYGAGTWHAPMVVLGEKEIEFVVVQHANGVAEEDCQEVKVESLEKQQRIAVIIDGTVSDRDDIMKAKL